MKAMPYTLYLSNTVYTLSIMLTLLVHVAVKFVLFVVVFLLLVFYFYNEFINHIFMFLGIY